MVQSRYRFERLLPKPVLPGVPVVLTFRDLIMGIRLLVPLVVAGLLAGLSMAACDSSDAIEGDSHLRLRLTDAPVDDIAEAHVVITRIELHGTGEEVLVLADDPQPFDLLTLQDGVTVTLLDLDIPDDTYHQLRLVVAEEAEVIYTDGTTEALKIPSGTETGLKINLPHLVLDDDVLDVTLDFDVADSFVKRGNSGKGYIFKPVIKPLALLINGEPIAIDDEDDIIDD